MLRRGLLVAVLAALSDQATKAAILRLFAGRPPGDRLIPVTSYFDIVLTYNHGMSFGLFDHGSVLNTIIFSAIAIAVIVVLGYWLRRAVHPLLGIAIGLIIGGAIGNLTDRLRLGGVVDFLYFHVGPYAWPAFNLADTAICVGVGAMLLDGLLLHREAH